MGQNGPWKNMSLLLPFEQADSSDPILFSTFTHKDTHANRLGSQKEGHLTVKFDSIRQTNKLKLVLGQNMSGIISASNGNHEKSGLQAASPSSIGPDVVSILACLNNALA